MAASRNRSAPSAREWRQARRGRASAPKRMREQGLKPPIDAGMIRGSQSPSAEPSVLDCGWGRLIFAQHLRRTPTFHGRRSAARRTARPARHSRLCAESACGCSPSAPQELFLDPSHTYRLDLSQLQALAPGSEGLLHPPHDVTRQDAEAINRIYAARAMMVPVPPNSSGRIATRARSRYLVAEDDPDRRGCIGTVTGVDHMRAFNDPERGSSLWCLAVDPAARHPGIGEALVRRLAEYFHGPRRRLSRPLGSARQRSARSRFTKSWASSASPSSRSSARTRSTRRLFTGPSTRMKRLNPYAKIIVNEARRRGISGQDR